MSINWYPGHMVTARKEAAAVMAKTDVVIEVLDARAPLSSCNPMIETLRCEYARPALKVLNKSDVADAAITARWLAYYNAQPNTRAIALTSKKPNEAGNVIKGCSALVPGRGTLAKPLRMMILGIPNVGKSTLMNLLLKRSTVKVGNEPGVTKNQQRHQIGTGMWLIDTPGMLWPGVPQDVALKLAMLHSIGHKAYENTSVATELAQYLLNNYANLIAQRYGAPPPAADGAALLSHIAQARSMVMKGGVLDIEKSALLLLTEFRGGILGRISLEIPEAISLPLLTK